MKITDLLARESIELNGQVRTKGEALAKMADLMAASGKIKDKKTYQDALFQREQESTTAVGENIAIPHAKNDTVLRPGLAAMLVPGGVDFNAVDDQPVQLIFAIAAPNTKENVHLDVLSKLSVMLMDEGFVKKLKSAESPEEFLNIIDAADEERSLPAEHISARSSKGYDFVAVTSCPTGIAHTYMAAEGLEKKAKELGYTIKVETRGSGGAKNVLTKEEIENAKCVIIAADAEVPMERFHGKQVLYRKVADGINKADQLFNLALSGSVPVYHAENATASNEKPGDGESIGHQIYKHLMSGVSHMLPFVVGGGILIAIAFLIDGLKVDLNSVSSDIRANFGTITPLAAFFKNLGNVAFGFMLPVLAGFIAMSIADRPGLAPGFVGGAIAASGTSGFLGALVAGFLAGYIVVLLKKIFSGLPKSLEGIKPVLLYPLLGVLLTGIIMMFVIEPPVGWLNTAMNQGLGSLHGASKIILGLILGGMMSIDMGGPFNKAAYVFGTASIAAGNYDIMAAVMIGGMVPPCAIALSSMIFRNKFTAEDRKSAPANFVMGLSFITEGAIPFAAADPLRVLPSCIIGSAAAGALSMAFNCTLMAPHGGIFVFPVVGNAIMYLLALIAGTVIAAVLLGMLKKNIQQKSK